MERKKPAGIISIPAGFFLEIHFSSSLDLKVLLPGKLADRILRYLFWSSTANDFRKLLPAAGSLTSERYMTITA
jgi:hypothetical protein